MRINTGNKEFKENTGSFRNPPEALAKGNIIWGKELACTRIGPQVLHEGHRYSSLHTNWNDLKIPSVMLRLEDFEFKTSLDDKGSPCLRWWFWNLTWATSFDTAPTHHTRAHDGSEHRFAFLLSCPSVQLRRETAKKKTPGSLRRNWVKSYFAEAQI